MFVFAHLKGDGLPSSSPTRTHACTHALLQFARTPGWAGEGRERCGARRASSSGSQWKEHVLRVTSTMKHGKCTQMPVVPCHVFLRMTCASGSTTGATRQLRRNAISPKWSSLSPWILLSSQAAWFRLVSSVIERMSWLVPSGLQSCETTMKTARLVLLRPLQHSLITHRN